jgi:PAS domain-containing protein
MTDAAAHVETTSSRETTASQTSALLDALFANAPVGLAFWDRDMRYQRINAELAAMNGVPIEAHIGRRPSDVLPGLGPHLETAFRRVLQEGEPLHNADVSGETPAAPGVTRHWLASYFPARDDGGQIVGITGLVIEVTGERQASRRADEALRRSAFVDAELRALYAALPVGVAFLSPDLRYQRVNETLARMNGRLVDEHVGASLEDILGPHAALVAEALRGVMATREPLELELHGAPPGEPETVRAFEATYFPVVTAGGELLGVGGVVRDVTDRHELEAQQSRLLREALTARAQAEAARVRADDAREEAERAHGAAAAAHGRAALLATAGRELASSMDYEATLRTVARSAVPEFADWSSVTVVERGELRVLAVAHTDPAREELAWAVVRRYPQRPDAPTGAARVIRSGEPEILCDLSPDAIGAAAHDAEHLRLLTSLDVRHYAAAPLVTPQGVIGAVTFVRSDPERCFTSEDVQFMTSLASRAALHIHNARLYTERSHIADTLQRSLLPRSLPAIPGAEVAARFLPAGDENIVGGDFFDVFASRDGAWTAIVGDVAGKGAEAAAFTSLARHTLRTASILQADPAANLDLLNRVLRAESPTLNFCTVLYVRISAGGSAGGLQLCLSNGGHPSPLLLRGDGGLESVDDGRGALVGALPDASFTTAELPMRPGDLLLLYTDGVTEIRARDAGLGDRELRRTLAEHAGAPAAEVVEAVERRAVELQDGAPRDDIAVVAIKATGEREGTR